jgi:hypothetical protein
MAQHFGGAMMFDEIFSALVAAWRVAVVASVLLYAALAVAPFWDRTTYISALEEALTMDHL